MKHWKRVEAVPCFVRLRDLSDQEKYSFYSQACLKPQNGKLEKEMIGHHSFTHNQKHITYLGDMLLTQLKSGCEI